MLIAFQTAEDAQTFLTRAAQAGHGRQDAHRAEAGEVHAESREELATMPMPAAEQDHTLVGAATGATIGLGAGVVATVLTGGLALPFVLGGLAAGTAIGTAAGADADRDELIAHGREFPVLSDTEQLALSEGRLVAHELSPEEAAPLLAGLHLS